MLHELPITNVHLQACAVGADKLTPVPGGHFCADCQRTVHDFTQATAADLARARAEAPDGRLCGRFRLSQLAPEARPTVRLRPKLQRFLLALVLVVLQGFSARQAWAQAASATGLRQKLDPLAQRALLKTATIEPITHHAVPSDTTRQEQVFMGISVEQMPEPPGGIDGFRKFLRANLHYPSSATKSGKVFVHFVVQENGQLTDFEILKGLEPVIDAEVLRVMKAMPRWTPGSQNGRAVPIYYTMPITFDAGPAKANKSAAKTKR